MPRLRRIDEDPGPDLQARPVHCYFFVFVSTGIAATK